MFTKTDLNKTLLVKPAELLKRRVWHKVDAEGQTLWRLAAKIAKVLMWKNKAYYSDMWDAWDFVLVHNAEKVSATWNKMDVKMYYRHSWWKGNMKEITLWDLLKKSPTKALWFAVRGMLPDNKLRDPRLKRLKFAHWKDINKYDHFKTVDLI